MTTEQLLAIVADRGLRIVLEEGRPVLKRRLGNEGVTDELLAVLKIHRERIIEQLKEKS